MAHLQAPYLEGSWRSHLRTWTGPWVLVIDELGLPADGRHQRAMDLPGRSRRYERVSIVHTSTRGFGDGGQVLATSVIGTATLDRLLHHARLRRPRPAGTATTARSPASRRPPALEVGGGQPAQARPGPAVVVPAGGAAPWARRRRRARGRTLGSGLRDRARGSPPGSNGVGVQVQGILKRATPAGEGVGGLAVPRPSASEGVLERSLRLDTPVRASVRRHWALILPAWPRGGTPIRPWLPLMPATA